MYVLRQTCLIVSHTRPCKPGPLLFHGPCHIQHIVPSSKMWSCAGSWDPLSYVQRSQDLTSGQVPANLSSTVTGKPIHEFMPYDGSSKPKRGKRSKRGRSDMYMLPVEYTSVKDGPEVWFCSHTSGYCPYISVVQICGGPCTLTNEPSRCPKGLYKHLTKASVKESSCKA